MEKSKGARFSLETKVFASKLNYVSPKWYRFARKHLKCPLKKVVQELVNNALFKEGLDEPMLTVLTSLRLLHHENEFAESII